MVVATLSLVMNTHQNQKAIRKATAHLTAIYALCEDLTGEYGATAKPLLKHYSECFNYISVVLLPQFGMTNDEIADLVMSIGETSPEVMGDMSDHFHPASAS